MIMKKYLLLLMFFLFMNTVYSQVGINTENPNSLTELDVQNLTKEGIAIPKGIMIPRMTEVQRNTIDISDPTNANSLMVYNTTEDCYNYYSKIEGKWESLCGKLGKAQFDFDCSAVVALGTYVEKKETTPSNMLKFVITVTKPGSYDITGVTTNGYYFSTSGTFLANGTYTVYAEGKGTPLVPGVNVVTLSKNGEEVKCTEPVKATVVPAIAIYSLNCSSLAVTGTYAKGTALTTQTITLNVTVTTAGSYSITTPVTNGIQFSASGNLSVGTQPITLVGTGNPTVNSNFPITVNANTPAGNNICSVIIPIILPKMLYAVIGYGEYSWIGSARQLALHNGASFGPAGIVKTLGFTQLWSTIDVNVATTYLNLGFSGQQPDIVLYFAYGANPTTALSTALANYVNQGGVLIYGTADDTNVQANILLNGIFGNGAGTAVNRGVLSSRNAYPINTLPNDPIVNGPFGNTSGRYWGEDNTGTIYVTQLPSNSVQIASANNQNQNTSLNPASSVVWYNESKNFVYFGDSVFGTYPGWGYYGTSDGSAGTQFSAAGVPEAKTFANYPYVVGTVYAYNAALELNALAWSIKKAAVSGINPH